MSLSASDATVVIINWNGLPHLRTCLGSVLDCRPGELILVDNGSSDGSVEYVNRTFPMVRVLRNSVNRGFAHPNNLAAAEAGGEVLALLNNDMRCHPDWLKEGVAALEGTDCVASRILDWEGRRIDYNGSSLQYLGFALQRDLGMPADTAPLRDRVLFPCGGAMLIRKSLFLELGGFDEDFFALFEDVDFGWRLWITGHEVRLCPASLVFHRGHSTFNRHAAAKMRYLMHRNCLLTILKNYDDENLRRIFPAAVLLALKRAVRLSGVRKESLYLWSDTRQALLDWSASGSSDALEDALNHLVALDDVVAALPAVLDRRRHIQARRKRGDAEILELFVDPLRAVVEDPDYILEEAGLLTSLGLDGIFPVAAYRNHACELPDPVPERLRRARTELKSLQWNTVHALLHPVPPLPESPLRRLIGLCRRQGWRAAAGAVWRRIRRGNQRRNPHL